MTDMIEKTEITEKAYLAEKRLGIAEFRNNRLAVSGLLLIVVLCILSLFAPEIAPHDPFVQRLDSRLLSPSQEYPFGTDELGRCIFSRVIYGTRISLGIGILVVAATSVAGTAIGLLSGYSGGLLDEALMRGVDIVMAFPQISSSHL